MQWNDKYFVWNSIVTEGVKDRDLKQNMAHKQSKELPIVLTKTRSSTSTDELIQFDPPELCFPFLPNKTLVSAVNITNVTDYHVGFNIYYYGNKLDSYILDPPQGILPPRSTQKVNVRTEAKEMDPEVMQGNYDRYMVWNRIMTEGVEASDISGYMIDEESKELPVVHTKTTPCTSNELIQFDPPELTFPFLPNKTSVCSINIVNLTDHSVGFNVHWSATNAAWYSTKPDVGILPPRSTQRLIVKRATKEKELENMHCRDKYFVWNAIVTEGVEDSHIYNCCDDERSKELPILLQQASLSTSNELIQFDPPQLQYLSVPDKRVPMVCLMKIVNATDHRVGYKTWSPEKNPAWYLITPNTGILPPQSTQVIKVKRTPKEGPEDQYCEDTFGVWNGFVTEGVEVGDLTYMDDDESKMLPIVLTKASLCTSNELIQFHPPQLRFLTVPDKRVPMLRLMKIVNTTDHSVGFNTWFYEKNSANYITEPDVGILPPQSTQVIKVKRTSKKEEQEDMQCEDTIGVWNGIVSEDVTASDVRDYMDDDESKLLPIVLTKLGESSSM